MIKNEKRAKLSDQSAGDEVDLCPTQVLPLQHFICEQNGSATSKMAKWKTCLAKDREKNSSRLNSIS